MWYRLKLPCIRNYFVRDLIIFVLCCLTFNG
nr:MAG TPA: NUC194 domain protein [Herelleviridae sp.]